MPWSMWLYHLFHHLRRRRALSSWESEFRGLEKGPKRAQGEVSRKHYLSAGPPESPLSPLPLFFWVLPASCALLSPSTFSVTSSPVTSLERLLRCYSPTSQATQSPSQALFSESRLRAGFPPLSSLRCILKASMRNYHVKTSQHLLAKLLVKILYIKPFSAPHGKEPHSKSFSEFSSRNKKYILKLD